MQDFTKQQKVIKVGNSYAVTLDKRFVAHHQLQSGDPIIASYSPTLVALAVPVDRDLKLRDAATSSYTAGGATTTTTVATGRKASKAEQRAVIHSKITPEFGAWVEKTLVEDKEALEELARL